MLHLITHTETNLKHKPALIFKNCSYMCAYHCAQLSYTTQHRTVLIFFLLILQTIIIAQIMFTGGGKASVKKTFQTQRKYGLL